MDPGLRSPLLDFFKRGEVSRDVRLLTAAGMLAPLALEQIGLLALLTGDGDDEICRTAEATLAAIPKESVAAFLGRSDVPEGLRDFFRGPGIEPLPGSDAGDAPLVDPEGGAAPAETEEGEEDQQSFTQKLALLGVADA